MIKLITFVALAVVSKLACANMITNGGFESSLVGNWTRTQPYPCTSFNTTFFQEGTRSISIKGCNPAATIAQSITGLTVGETYNLSYWLKSDSHAGSPVFSTTLGGTVLSTLNPTASFDWTQYSFDWVASNTSANLVFSALQTSNNNGWYLDNVVLDVVQQVAVSEPGSMLLLGIGAMMFGFAIRERARSL
jgi:hypothetical protein